MTQQEWAHEAATKLLGQFTNAAAIDTADYQLCGFILAAALLVTIDKDFAERIGNLMEPQRYVND